MNVLFFTYDFPYPTNSGGKTRAYNLLKFAKRDANVTLFSFVRNFPSVSEKEAIRKLGVEDISLFPRKKIFNPRNLKSIVSKHSIFYSLYFDQKISSKLLSVVKTKKIDLIHFESFYTGFYLHQELQQLGVKQVFGSENIEYLLYKDYSNQKGFLPRLFLDRQVRKIKNEEEHFYEQSDCVLTVTESEKNYVASISKTKTMVIENGVDVEEFKQKKSKNEAVRTLLFIGNFSYFPNVDGMRWFMENIFPKLPSDVRIVVIGKKATMQSFLQNVRVEIEEYVENIVDAYARGVVMIAPLRIGGGTNFKILEAMASRIPVVTLASRVEAFGFKDGKELMIATSAEEFLAKTVQLLSSEKLRATIVESAFAEIEKSYDWKIIGAKLHTTWKSLIYEKS